MAPKIEKVVSFPWDSAYRYSQAIRIGDLVFVSGQASIGEDGGVVGVGDFLAQAHHTFANLRAVLEAAESALDRVAKLTIFLTDMANFPHVVDLRGQYFSEPYPADTTVQVQALALPDLMLEIEAVALGGR